jgi:hypothetical protein
MKKASTEKRPVLRFIVVALILLVAGAEIGIALQLVGVIDLVGVELFLMLFFGGFLWRLRVVANVIKTALERLDPFFFLRDRRLLAVPHFWCMRFQGWFACV